MVMVAYKDYYYLKTRQSIAQKQIYTKMLSPYFKLLELLQSSIGGNMSNKTKICSNSYTEIIPYYPYSKKESGWRDGMITGNGENGVVCSCSPYTETYIFQNMYFITPGRQPRFVPPEVTGELHEARQSVINFDDTWNVHDRKRTYLYCYHPGHQLRLNMQKENILNYTRETDYETAEVVVKYTDKNGTWTRRTFTSREDNITITQITKSAEGTKLNLDISLDDLASMKYFRGGIWGGNYKRDNEYLQYKKLIAQDCSSIGIVAHYPEFEGSELAEGGYAGITRIITIGGQKTKICGSTTDEENNIGVDKNSFIRINDTDEVYLITKCDCTHQMGQFDTFKDTNDYDLVNQLLADTAEIEAKYTDNNGGFSYAAALEPHRKKQSALYNAVTFSLGSEEDKNLYNEELLKKQKTSNELIDAVVERAYNQGRYAQICCAGYSAPRLCGLWSGEWNAGWNGAYTMDANVNIQASGMNTGNIYDAAIGYIYFILRQVKDWTTNAQMVYGMKDAILIPVNTDGDSAVLVEYDQYYPFQYWNAGVSWVLLPIFEFWQCFGNCKIPVNDKVSHLYKQEYLDLEKDILYPLLTMQANFWAQLCTPEYYTDANGIARYTEGKKELLKGEKYLIIPSYSPENKPNGYNSTITANATMDISAARDGLNMVIAIEKALAYEGYEKDIEKWEYLKNRLPEYKYDKTGALCEWSMSNYKENNVHRHISHLYCAWPAYEARNDVNLTRACNIAIDNRNRENKGGDDTSSHGWVHKLLVAARLKNSKAAYDMLYTLMSSNIYFSSFMTDHNIDRSIGVYCTDTSIGTVGVINEMLLYSNTGEIELLPALPSKWTKGSINGLMARTNAQVTKLEWNLEEGNITASIRSDKEQLIKLFCLVGKETFTTSDGKVYHNGDIIKFHKNEEITVVFHNR